MLFVICCRNLSNHKNNYTSTNNSNNNNNNKVTKHHSSASIAMNRNSNEAGVDTCAVVDDLDDDFDESTSKLKNCCRCNTSRTKFFHKIWFSIHTFIIYRRGCKNILFLFAVLRRNSQYPWDNIFISIIESIKYGKNDKEFE
jgi:hypothetical protein